MENKDVNYWGAKAEEFYNAGNFDEVIKCCVEITRLDPNNSNIFYNWGTTLFNLAILKQDNSEKESLFQESCKKYTEATRLNPNNPNAFYSWGAALFNLAAFKQDNSEKESLFQESCEKYTEATRLNPNNSDAFNNWGIALSDLAELKQDNSEKESLFQESCEKYTEATRLNPNNPDAFSNWGVALSNLAELKQDNSEKESLFQESCEKYTEATRLNPNNSDAFNNWGAALSNLAKLKQDNSEKESLFQESCEKYKEATCLNSDDFNAFSNWGASLFNLAQLRQDKSIFIDAISKFSESIKINVQYTGAYKNRSIVYDYLEMFPEKFSDINTYLYWSIKQEEKVEISELLKTFEEYPQNILTILNWNWNDDKNKELKDVDIPRFLANQYHSTKSKISDFSTWIDYLEKAMKDKRSLLGLKSILYYYLGGYVDSFIILNEELNVKYNLTSQEFFYYAKIANEIKVEPQTILQKAISRLETREKDSTDYYYLGHLYLMSGNEEQAKECFKQSGSFLFAKIMLLSLKEENIATSDIISKLQTLTLQCEIDYTQRDLSQFQDFFHFSECADALSELEEISTPAFEPLIWKAFQLSESAKYFIDEQLRQFISEKIKNGVLEQWEYQIRNSSEEIRNEKMDIIEGKIINNRPNVDEVFEKIKEKAEKKGKSGNKLSSYETQLYIFIDEQNLTAKDYLSFILYFLLNMKISTEEAFYLLFYLKCKMKEKFYQGVDDLIKQEINSFPYIGNFSRILSILLYLFNKESMNWPPIDDMVNENQSGLEKKQAQFKTEICWKLILMEYNALGKDEKEREANFNEQYELSIIEDPW